MVRIDREPVPLGGCDSGNRGSDRWLGCLCCDGKRPLDDGRTRRARRGDQRRRDRAAPTFLKSEPNSDEISGVPSGRRRMIMSARSQRRLERPDDRVIAGVCQGLGNYFDIDPVVVRIIFVVLSAAAGAGVLVYLILWVVMPATGSAVATGGAGIGEGVRTMATELRDVGREFGNSVAGAWPPPPPPPPSYPPA